MTDNSQPQPTLGKYRILAELGKGGFATVYRALDTALNREVALKVLHAQLLADPTFVARFVREAQALAQLRHAHIITVYDVGQAEQRLYIAMELARGPDLGKAIAERGRYTWSEALGLLEPVCEALDYAHQHGTVHRDLKPSNILLDAERGPLLTDLGFARLMSGSSTSLSQSGGILGTPSYIAPEVWELDAADPPADVYALGCIVYEMLTGEVLFKGTTPMQVMRAHDRGPQYAATWDQSVPAGLDEVLGRALARDPKERLQSAGGLRAVLEELDRRARSAREQNERQTLADQWRIEAEQAIAAGEWNVARMALGRWLAAAPQDPLALKAQARVAAAEAEQDRADLELGMGAFEQKKALQRRDEEERQQSTFRDNERARRLDEMRQAAETSPQPTVPPEPTAQPKRVAPVPTAPPVPVEGRRGGAGWLWPALAGAALLLLYLAFRPGGFGFAPQATPTPRPPTSVSSGPAAGDTRVLEKAGITLVFVPAGSFEMGSNETEIDAALALCENYYCTFPRYWYETESPRHTVTLPEYWIGQTEVTNAQYRRFIDDGGYDKQSYWSAAGWSWKEERGISAPRFWTDSDWNGDSYPVVGVSWYEAEAYCRWAGARLPTEEEWEKASRGTDGRIFSWGSKWDGGRLNYCDSGCPYGWKDTAVNDGYFTTAPVGTYPRGASPYGALDMAGNVWEWVNAWYKGYPGTTYQNREFGEIYRVLRGGSWFHGPEQARCASRFRWLPDARGSWVGFRVVQ